MGYRQAAQFAKTFRRHHGRPPSSFRREGRSDAPAGSLDGHGPAQEGPARLDGHGPALGYSPASA